MYSPSKGCWVQHPYTNYALTHAKVFYRTTKLTPCDQYGYSKLLLLNLNTEETALS